MIVAIEDGRQRALVVTYPLKDKVGLFILLVLWPIAFAVYVSLTHLSRSAIFLSALIVVCSVFVAVAFLRTKVVVRRDAITERILRTRHFGIPPGKVQVLRKGHIVCVVTTDSTFEYRFPKGLAHGGMLEDELRQFFGVGPLQTPL